MGYREFESNKSPPTPPGAPSKLFSLKGEIKKKSMIYYLAESFSRVSEIYDNNNM